VVFGHEYWLRPEMVKRLMRRKILNDQTRSWVYSVSRLADLLLLLAMAILLLVAELANAGEKITIGEVEDVILMPWGVRLPARIDTGATTSSLDARGLKVKNNVAEFKLPKRYGGLQLHLPVREWQNIRSADFKEKRPVVEITFCMGPKILCVEVNLNDRSTVKYPIILGHNTLKENFVVDCAQSNCLPPGCPGAPPK
jgi:hypothetical protein